jgi:hypothetical protein
MPSAPMRYPRFSSRNIRSAPDNQFWALLYATRRPASLSAFAISVMASSISRSVHPERTDRKKLCLCRSPSVCAGKFQRKKVLRSLCQRGRANVRELAHYQPECDRVRCRAGYTSPPSLGPHRRNTNRLQIGTKHKSTTHDIARLSGSRKPQKTSLSYASGRPQTHFETAPFDRSGAILDAGRGYSLVAPPTAAATLRRIGTRERCANACYRICYPTR